eukprot:scaffold137740_cov50-Attheya_sp.AAC.1
MSESDKKPSAATPHSQTKLIDLETLTVMIAANAAAIVTLTKNVKEINMIPLKQLTRRLTKLSSTVTQYHRLQQLISFPMTELVLQRCYTP